MAALVRYTTSLLRWRWPIVVLAVLVMLALAGGAGRIGVANDYRSLFSEDNAELAAFDALEDTYSASNVALIAVAPREGSVVTREVLGAIENLTETAWGARHVSCTPPAGTAGRMPAPI